MLLRREDFIAMGCITALGLSIVCMTVQALIFAATDTPTVAPSETVYLTATPTPESACYAESCISACLGALAGAGSIHDEPNNSRLFSHGKEYLLTEYIVGGDKIFEPVKWGVPAELRDYQGDTATQLKIWEMFTAYFPPELRTEVSDFLIFTDGPGEKLAGVDPSEQDPTRWTVEVDIADSQNNRELTYTLVHEFGHLLTLNADQVPPAMDVYRHPDDKYVYNEAADACPDYFTGEGCSRLDSYINQFYGQYWSSLYDEWQTIDAIRNDDEHQARLDQFYDTYADQFVSDYAATNPEEDIAESFTHFILEPAPRGDSIADQKISFFYSFAELVTLRTRLQQRICGRLNP